MHKHTTMTTGRASLCALGELSLSRFIVHDTSEERRPRDGWLTVHWPAVPPARVPGYPQRDCGRVAAPRAILCGRVASV
jgi:hypothetical protein